MTHRFLDFLTDIRHGFRMMVKNPSFTLVNVLTLAIAIGATTAVWGAVRSTIIDPLPVENAERVMTVESRNAREGHRSVGINPATIDELRRHAETFGDFAVHLPISVKYRGGDYTELIPGAGVSPNFFSLWNVPPLKGRVFAPDEGSPDAERVVVIGHAFWQSYLHGDPDVIGRTIEFDNGTLESPYRHYTIIGVMPRHFVFPNPYTNFWMPVADPPVRSAADDRNGSRFVLRNYVVTSRLPAAATVVQAQAILDAISARQAREADGFARTNVDWSMAVRPAGSLFADEGVRVLLWVLSAVIGLVWLIACANVANLLLARSEARLHEMTMRAVLGAERGRLLRQMLTESLLLAAIGGGLGLILTNWGLDALEKILVGVRLKPFAMDWSVFASTAFIAALTGVVFGLVPAWRVSRPRPAETLKQSGAAITHSGSSRWFVNGLIGGEIALAVILLFGSGLLIRSAVNALRVDVGFVKENLVRANAMVPFDKYGNDSDAYRAFVRKLTDELAGLPGVVSIGMLNSGDVNRMVALGVAGDPNSVEVGIEGCGLGEVNPFAALGVPLIAGRFLDRSDVQRSTVVVNQSFAQAMWPGKSAVGHSFRPAPGVDAPQRVYEVVGVVGDARLFEFTGPVRPTMYRPSEEILSQFSAPWFYLRTGAEAPSVVPAVHRAITLAEPGVIRRVVQVVSDEIRQRAQGRRFFALYLTLYGAVGVALAAIGLYALMSFRVQRRTREIGVRMALGATDRQILTLTMAEGLKVAVAGAAIGMAIALAGARLLRAVLFGVEPADPPTMAVAAITILMVASFACYFPARRAARVDPMTALRSE